LRGVPIACQKPVGVSRPGNRQQRQNRNDSQCSHCAIVVFDCGQKRQSLAHFLDVQEKHHGCGCGRIFGQRIVKDAFECVTSFLTRLSREHQAGVAGFTKAISIDPTAIYNYRMRE
jgi:hypothetical protein